MSWTGCTARPGVDAEDPGLQAPLDGDEDGPQVQGHDRHRHGPRACYEARKERPGRKPLVARFGGIPLKRQRKAVIDDRLPAPAIRRKELVTRLLRGECEMVRPAGHGGNPPGPQAGRPHLAGAAATPVGGPDGENAAQDAHRLRTLPPGHPRREASRGLHVNIAGEPDASKGARPVRTGGRRKRACTQAPRRRPTGGVPAKLGLRAAAGGRGPALLAAGVLSVGPAP